MHQKTALNNIKFVRLEQDDFFSDDERKWTISRDQKNLTPFCPQTWYCNTIFTSGSFIIWHNEQSLIRYWLYGQNSHAELGCILDNL